jgi:hypothetical protein
MGRNIQCFHFRAHIKILVNVLQAQPVKQSFPILHGCTGFEPTGVCINFRNLITGNSSASMLIILKILSDELYLCTSHEK